MSNSAYKIISWFSIKQPTRNLKMTSANVTGPQFLMTWEQFARDFRTLSWMIKLQIIIIIIKVYFRPTTENSEGPYSKYNMIKNVLRWVQLKKACLLGCYSVADTSKTMGCFCHTRRQAQPEQTKNYVDGEHNGGVRIGLCVGNKEGTGQELVYWRQVIASNPAMGGTWQRRINKSPTVSASNEK